MNVATFGGLIVVACASTCLLPMIVSMAFNVAFEQDNAFVILLPLGMFVGVYIPSVLLSLLGIWVVKLRIANDNRGYGRAY